jgi:uncharacterized protein
MPAEKDIFINKAKMFLDFLRQDGIDVADAYLFGSVVEGRANDESDIDVAVVSKDFQGIPFFDMQRIGKHRRRVDLRLEIHPFSLHDVQTDPSLFYLKIKQVGIQIS